MRRTLAGTVIATALAAIGILVLLWLDRESGSGTSTEIGREASGEAVAAPRLEGNVPPPTAEHETAGPASISGTVTRDGAPASARVEVRTGRYNFGDQSSLLLRPYGAEAPLATTGTAEDGTYRLSGLDIGSYEVTAHADDGATAWGRGFCRPAEPHFVVHLELMGGPAVLVGRAVHEDGSPFRGFAYAYVGQHSRGQGITPLPPVATDEQGRFRLQGLPDDEIELCLVSPERLLSTFGGVQVPQREERIFVVEDGLERLSGTVVADDTGEAISSATITCYGRTEKPPRRLAMATDTDVAGAFEIRLPSLSGTLWVYAEGFAPLQYPLTADKSLDLRIKRRGRVTGLVVEKDGGRPVAGAEVHGWNWYTFGMESPLDVSAEDGTFEGEVGPGKGMIYVLDTRWVSAGLSNLTTRDLNPTYVKAEQGVTAEVVVEVVPAGRIAGSLTDAGGRPLEGVFVTIAHPPRWEGFQQAFLHGDLCSCTTDAEGRFLIEGLVPDFPYLLQAEPTVGLPATGGPVVAVTGETVEVDLRVPGTLRLDVHVVEKGSGRPVAGALVNARQRNHGASATTGEDGRAHLEPLLPVPLVLAVQCEGYVSPTGDPWMVGRGGLEVDPSSQGSDPVVIELTKGASFAGRILAADGSPWTEGGMLMVMPVGAPAGRGLGLVGGLALAETGVFDRVGPVPTGTYDIVLTDGALTNRKLYARWTVDTGTDDLVLRVDPTKVEAHERDKVVLEVVDAGGIPVAGWIRVYARSGERWAWLLRQGQYVPDGLRPGTTVWIHVYGAQNEAGKAGGAWVGPQEVKAGANRIELPPPSAIAGTVTGPDGKPVAGLSLLFEAVPPDGAPHVPETFALPQVRTDGAGHFEVDGLGPGRHRIAVQTPDTFALVPPVEVEAGRADVAIRLESPSSVEVRVFTVGQKPVAGATVKLTLVGVPGAERLVVSDEEGRTRLVGLSPRIAYDLTVEPPGTRADLASAWREDWMPAALEVVLPPGRVVEGTVRQGDAALPYGTVWWQDGRGRWLRAQAGQAGLFRVTVLAEGDITFRPGPSDAQRVEQAGAPVVLPPDAAQIDLRLP